MKIMTISELHIAVYKLKAWHNRWLAKIKSSSMFCGMLLICATALALVMSNLPGLSHLYNTMWDMAFSISLGNFPPIEFTLLEVVNEGLMSVFFFSVGLEIKREFKFGHLSTWKQASLPVFAALGGMLFPALIYLLCNSSSPETIHGWGVPMATDIAFSLGILSMFSKKVPLSLKVFLTTLAVADDLGSIMVIALFYSNGLNMTWVILSLLITFFMFLLNYLKVYSTSFYVIPSILIWFCFMFAGVHVTIAGVIIAFALPIESRFSKKYLKEKALCLIEDLDVTEPNNYMSPNAHRTLLELRVVARNTIPPLQRLEDSLAGFVNFIIMPLFAFANAGVYVEPDAFSNFLSFESLGIILGLVVGKPLGICLVSYLLIKLHIASNPDGAHVGSFLGVGLLGGIGFTMSIFVDNLAFVDNQSLINVGKLAVLAGSLLSALLGTIVLLSLKNIDEKFHW